MDDVSRILKLVPQRWAARITGVPQAAISRFLAGKAKLGPENEKKIIDAESTIIRVFNLSDELRRLRDLKN